MHEQGKVTSQGKYFQNILVIFLEFIQPISNAGTGFQNLA